MPVRVETIRSSHDRQGGASRAPRSPLAETSKKALTIGLINNMGEGAFKATERQFTSLLDSASEAIPVSLSLYVLPNMGNHVRGRYQSVEALWDTQLDGLIVTGREPATPNLSDEPYWPSFVQVLEWARGNTHSTIWSCLAAHAAVLHMDRIGRRKNEEKHFGIFQCEFASRHRLTAGAPSRFPVPHSRWNGLSEPELVAHGYRVLTRTAEGEVDAFAREGNSLFVFFQGHPEYESGALMREYRRDVARYLRDEAQSHPSIPHGYFERSTEAALTALREKAIACRSNDLLANVSTVLEEAPIENTWHSTASLLYRNWLEYLCERKYAEPPPRAAAASAG